MRAVCKDAEGHDLYIHEFSKEFAIAAGDGMNAKIDLDGLAQFVRSVVFEIKTRPTDAPKQRHDDTVDAMMYAMHPNCRCWTPEMSVHLAPGYTVEDVLRDYQAYADKQGGINWQKRETAQELVDRILSPADATARADALWRKYHGAHGTIKVDDVVFADCVFDFEIKSDKAAALDRLCQPIKWAHTWTFTASGVKREPERYAVYDERGVTPEFEEYATMCPDCGKISVEGGCRDCKSCTRCAHGQTMPSGSTVLCAQSACRGRSKWEARTCLNCVHQTKPDADGISCGLGGCTDQSEWEARFG